MALPLGTNLVVTEIADQDIWFTKSSPRCQVGASPLGLRHKLLPPNVRLHDNWRPCSDRWQFHKEGPVRARFANGGVERKGCVLWADLFVNCPQSNWLFAAAWVEDWLEKSPKSMFIYACHTPRHAHVVHQIKSDIQASHVSQRLLANVTENLLVWGDTNNIKQQNCNKRKQKKTHHRTINLVW